MWPEFLEFCLEELVLITGYRLLVKDQHLRYIIVMDL
jgi:hypothetical protein